MDLGFIAGANTAGLNSGMNGLRTLHSHQESGSQGIQDRYASNKDPPGFIVEHPMLVGNVTHYSGSELYDDCTNGLEVYRLLNENGSSYAARKDHLEDDYRKALKDARVGRARTTKVTVRELIPCEYCMRGVHIAYLDGAFIDNTSIGPSEGLNIVG